MNEILIQDSLNVAEKVISNPSQATGSFNIWLWIAIGEFVIILGILYSAIVKKKKTAKNLYKEESLSKNIDFNNIINSSFHSTELYDILKVKCHPDRFPTDPELNSAATKLFQEITKNKANVKKLEELKIEAQKKLNINF